MNRMDPERIKKLLTENKLLVVMLTVGLLLLLIPSGSRKTGSDQASFTQEELKLSEVLSRIDGVGETWVLLSENPGRDKGYAGAVVVCRGASLPQVRLRVVETVSAFTGLGANKIVVQNLIS